VCTLLMRDGRVTLTDSKLIATREGRRVERPVKGRGEFDRLLRRWFGINLQNDSIQK
jgi:arylamine N-acetyltransferase